MTDNNPSGKLIESEPRVIPDAAAEGNEDLGIGRVAAERSSARFINQDGSFNTKRLGLGFLASQNAFYRLITLQPALFFGFLAVTFMLINLLFASLYWLCGNDALQSGSNIVLENRFWRGFFFSVQTLSTIGYGHVAPASLAANVVATAEAFVGLLAVALATGLLFARFSKPMTRILFSKNMLFAPYQNGTAWMVRVINGLRNEVIDIEALVTLSWYEVVNGDRVRKFHQLKLERQKVSFFNLSWTLVHPIGKDSPLWNVTEKMLLESDAEFLIVLQGVDDVLFQRVHARGSYKTNQAIWNAKFADIYAPASLGYVAVDTTKLSDYQKLG